MSDSIVEEFGSYLSPSEREMVETAKEFGRLVVGPGAAEWEYERRHPTEAVRAACAMGLGSIELPPTWGGRGLRFSAKLRAVEELAKYDFAFAFSLVNHHNATVRIANARPEVAQRLVPPMLAGDVIGCSAYTEPGHGSDLSGLATSARKVDGGWLISGEKAWITNAAVAGAIIVLAQTDPAAGSGGIASFIVEATRKGFAREDTYRLQAAHAIGTGGFRLDGYFAPDEALLDPPGTAFKTSLRAINGARAYVAAMCAGMLDSAIAHALGAASSRQAFGQRDRFSGRSVVAGRCRDRPGGPAAVGLSGQPPDRWGRQCRRSRARAKKFAGGHALGHVAACVQAMGATGLRSDHPLMRHLAACKVACFTDGTTEMMNERLGKLLIGRRAQG